MLKKVIVKLAKKQHVQGVLVAFVVAALAACDSGSGASLDLTLEDDPPDDCTAMDAQNCETTGDPQSPESPETPENPQIPGTTQSVSLDSPIAGTLSGGDSRLYKVPEDTQIILTSNSGDADLFLHDEVQLNDDSVICIARAPFDEDICSGSSDKGELYATVVARESSEYTIAASADCSVQAVNRWVYRSMLDYYLYADQVPTVNPDSYTDPSELIADLRFNSLEPFSSVGDADSRQALFEEGQGFGFGFSWGRDTDNNLRIQFVYDDSPFGRAGIKRGDIFSSLGGVLDANLTSDQFVSFIGSQENPLVADWEFIDGETGETKAISVAMSEFTLNTVLYSTYFTNENFSGKVGYIVFNSFLRISESELDDAINALAAAEVTELVLDLRYNGGGYTYIARRLAAQIRGETLGGQTAARYEHNDKYTEEDFETRFESATPALDLSRVIVLTTERTASSSELVINSLRPYMEVVTIGDTTVGKPFISIQRNFCGKAISAMHAQGVNANSVSVAGGITPDCFAADDPTQNFGLQSGSIEGMLSSALNYVLNETCETAPLLASRRTNEKLFIDENIQLGSNNDLPWANLPEISK